MTHDCDIAIVGSGAAGAVLAATLAERTEKSIVLIEKGPYYDKSFFDQRELDMSVLLADRGGRTTADGAYPVQSGECVGGGTTVNYALCFNPLPSVWNHWKQALGLADFSLSENSDDYGLPGLNFANALRDVRRRVNVHIARDRDLNDNNRLFARGLLELGIRPKRFELNMRNCIGCGYCGQGCAYDAKQSTMVTYVPDAMARGVKLIHSCDVQRVTFEKQRARLRAAGLQGIVAATRAGSRPNSVEAGPFELSARLVILSAGAVGTPVIMQRSGAPDPHDVIGRGVVLHPSLPVGGFFNRDLANYQNVSGSYYSDHLRESHGVMLECLFDHPVNTAIAIPGFATEHFDMMRRYRELAGFGAMLIDSVDAKNRVSWDPVKLKPSIQYRLGEADKERLRFGARAALQVMLAAGAHEAFLTSDEPIGPLPRPQFRSSDELDLLEHLTFRPYQTLLASAHVQASAKMGSDPRSSVFNARGESHHVANLIGCDASIFPTSCGANPMLAITTLARYQGLRIAHELRRYA
jgi:choline dehydrogenase-like flavoprotein